MTAGLIISGFGLAGFVYSIFIGSLIDKYGLKACLVSGNLIALAGLILIVFFKSVVLQVIFMLTFVSIGSSLVLPCLKVGVKYYTNESARSLGYSLLYLIIFTGGAIAGIFVDISLSTGGRNYETFMKILYVGIGLLSVSFCFSLFIRDTHHSTISNKGAFEITKEVISDKVFWKFIVLILLLVIIKSLFNHLTITLPIYMNRDVQKGAHFGIMLAVHKIIIVIFIPIMTSLVYFTSSYNLLIIGSIMSACSVIPLMFASTYLTVILFVIIVSIGESIYAPRLIDYTLSIAPPGKEGTFLAVASSPLMLGMILAGLVGGSLLQEYCPSHGERNCNYMWGIIGVSCLFTPIMMILFRRYLEESPKEVIKIV
jgi:MFS family permease